MACYWLYQLRCVPTRVRCKAANEDVDSGLVKRLCPVTSTEIWKGLPARQFYIQLRKRITNFHIIGSKWGSTSCLIVLILSSAVLGPRRLDKMRVRTSEYVWSKPSRPQSAGADDTSVSAASVLTVLSIIYLCQPRNTFTALTAQTRW